MIVLIDGDSIAYMAASLHTDRFNYEELINGKISEILFATGCSNYELYVECPEKGTMFRDTIAVTKKYKGNRAKLERPPLLGDAKYYMRDTWNANLVSVFESEDFVTKRAAEIGHDNCIIAAIDKDLYCNPGRFYNYRTGETKIVTQEQADLNLWRQVATGDNTDNIPGVPGIGPRKAEVVVDVESCVKLYKENGLSYEYFIEQFNLIYIRPSVDPVILYPLTENEWEEI